jgi:MerR family transcriptional regulator, heat shock protein HspR
MQASGDEPVYVISVAARLAGLPSWVLRVLDQQGIVVPGRTDSNRRLYSDNDIILLSRVRELTEDEERGGKGVNIAGVKVILEMEVAWREREREWQRRLADLETALEEHERAPGRPSDSDSPDLALATVSPTEIRPANGR